MGAGLVLLQRRAAVQGFGLKHFLARQLPVHQPAQRQVPAVQEEGRLSGGQGARGVPDQRLKLGQVFEEGGEAGPQRVQLLQDGHPLGRPLVGQQKRGQALGQRDAAGVRLQPLVGQGHRVTEASARLGMLHRAALLAGACPQQAKKPVRFRHRFAAHGQVVPQPEGRADAFLGLKGLQRKAVGLGVQPQGQLQPRLQQVHRVAHRGVRRARAAQGFPGLGNALVVQGQRGAVEEAFHVTGVLGQRRVEKLRRAAARDFAGEATVRDGHLGRQRRPGRRGGKWRRRSQKALHPVPVPAVRVPRGQEGGQRGAGLRHKRLLDRQGGG